jgi:hypothetical protein
MDKLNPLERAREALERVNAVDFSSPTRLEVRLDALASALIQVPVLKKKLKSVGRNSLGSILKGLVLVGDLEKTALDNFREIESLLEQLDYEAFEEEAAEGLESEVTEFYDAINTLLDKLQENEE